MPRHAAPRRRPLPLQTLTTALPSTAVRRGSVGLALTAVIGGVAVAGVAATPDASEGVASEPADTTPSSRQSPTPDAGLALVSGAAGRAGAVAEPTHRPKHRRPGPAVTGDRSATATTTGTPTASASTPPAARRVADEQSPPPPAASPSASPTETSPGTVTPTPTPTEDPSEEPTTDPLGDLVDVLDGLGQLTDRSAPSGSALP